jgi:hypothetical protein
MGRLIGAAWSIGVYFPRQFFRGWPTHPPDDDGESQIARVVQEGSAGEFPIGHHIVGEVAAGVFNHAAQEPASGVVLAIPGAVGFDIQEQGQAGSHHTIHDQLILVTEDPVLLIPAGTAQLTNLFAGSSGAAAN